MLLRSSSTPVLGSLLPSFSESPNNIISNHHFEAKPNTTLHLNNRLSIHQSWHATFSTNSSPISPSIDLDRNSQKGFRRAQSDGNLAGIAFDASSHSYDEDQFFSTDSHLLPSHNMFARRPKCLMLETIPSFSLRKSLSGFVEYEEEDEDEEDETDQEDYGENESGGVVAVVSVESAGLTEEVRVKDEIRNLVFGQQNETTGRGLYIEKELEVGGGGGSGGGGGGRGGEFNSRGGSGDGGDKQGGVEEYYKRMVMENPGNSMFLGNYAQFLHQSKGDLEGAEEFYSRAILADPKDGGVLSQYAKLVWELHHDLDRATSYFERAVQASPQDSHVQAAYASFLWETEDDEGDEPCLVDNHHAMLESVATGLVASITT